MESKTLRSTIRRDDNNGTLKWCRYCERWLPLPRFAVRRLSPDGLGYKCRECSSLYGKQTYQKPHVKEAIKNRATKWRLNNPERRLEIVHKSADKHREKKRAHSRAYGKRMRLLFPEKSRLAGRLAIYRRKAREGKAGNFPPIEIVQMILDMARGRCVYCGRTDRPLTIDHVTALSMGGSNQWDNFVPCCKSCNSSKNTKDAADWLYTCHGVQGLVDALVFIKSVAKAMKRLYPGIEILET